ncbi:hypothetical protein AQUCO_02000098v1 [Aquilegia coerulea]|uniref:tRNA synthetases class I catalytic domain-containing protein n=1 Tax=Aquilegia coerulea TaxID=218851 RepID=A0A2G5DFV7_AQUCA|nr:hypothetical protein AQUCO_02000098v1 [Aquilegia coerulea]
MVCVTFNILYRLLVHLGYQVDYVRNFTDLDNKIILRSNELGQDPLIYSSLCTEDFLKDMKKLNCLLPTYQPTLSEHMDQIRDMIAKIISNGYAYVVEDRDVYFSVDKFPDYGRLVLLALESRKQNSADFALWEASKPGESSWESPWGRGRPRWHIECFAMISYYLTSLFYIHGDAHSEADVKYWVHSGSFGRDGEKMSKSRKSHVTIRMIIIQYHLMA